MFLSVLLKSHPWIRQAEGMSWTPQLQPCAVSLNINLMQEKRQFIAQAARTQWNGASSQFTASAVLLRLKCNFWPQRGVLGEWFHRSHIPAGHHSCPQHTDLHSEQENLSFGCGLFPIQVSKPGAGREATEWGTMLLKFLSQAAASFGPFSPITELSPFGDTPVTRLDTISPSISTQCLCAIKELCNITSNISEIMTKATISLLKNPLPVENKCPLVLMGIMPVGNSPVCFREKGTVLSFFSHVFTSGHFYYSAFSLPSSRPQMPHVELRHHSNSLHRNFRKSKQ